MGRNDIRLRRHSISSGRIAQHRNYGELMARHERDQRIKRVIRVFIYFLIIAFLMVVMMMLSKWTNSSAERAKKTTVQNVLLFPADDASQPLA
jgi:predicted nucleic acid-binding Zn ribbon protein